MTIRYHKHKTWPLLTKDSLNVEPKPQTLEPSINVFDGVLVVKNSSCRMWSHSIASNDSGRLPPHLSPTYPAKQPYRPLHTTLQLTDRRKDPCWLSNVKLFPSHPTTPTGVPGGPISQQRSGKWGFLIKKAWGLSYLSQMGRHRYGSTSCSTASSSRRKKSKSRSRGRRAGEDLNKISTANNISWRLFRPGNFIPITF